MTKILLTAANIIEADDLRFEDVPVPEWAPKDTPEDRKADYVVRIRNMTAEGRGVFIQKTMDQAAYDIAKIEALSKNEPLPDRPTLDNEYLLVALTAIDENNALLFTLAHVGVLAKRNAVAIKRCAIAAQRLSGLMEEAKVEAQKVEG